MQIMGRKPSRTGNSPGFAEEQTSFGETNLGEGTLRARVEVGRSGRIVIPAAIRERMGIGEGSTLILLLKGEELEIFTPEAGIRRAQRLARQYSKNHSGRSAVDELLEERRRWAEEEENS